MWDVAIRCATGARWYQPMHDYLSDAGPYHRAGRYTQAWESSPPRLADTPMAHSHPRVTRAADCVTRSYRNPPPGSVDLRLLGALACIPSVFCATWQVYSRNAASQCRQPLLSAYDGLEPKPRRLGVLSVHQGRTRTLLMLLPAAWRDLALLCAMRLQIYRRHLCPYILFFCAAVAVRNLFWNCSRSAAQLFAGRPALSALTSYVLE